MLEEEGAPLLSPHHGSEAGKMAGKMKRSCVTGWRLACDWLAFDWLAFDWLSPQLQLVSQERTAATNNEASEEPDTRPAIWWPCHLLPVATLGTAAKITTRPKKPVLKARKSLENNYAGEPGENTRRHRENNGPGPGISPEVTR